MPTYSTDSAAITLTDLAAVGDLTAEGVAEFFDTLSPTPIGFMMGLWRAVVVPSCSPNQRRLLDSGYFGMRFTDPETVDPLLFSTADGTEVFAADPIKLFTLLQDGPTDIPAVRSDVEITYPAARLRMIDYRGVTSATLIYDRQPVLDHFRTLTDTIVLGAVEARGYQQPTYFALQRATPRAEQRIHRREEK